LRAAVREFKLAVHCCGYAELPELIRTHRCELVGVEVGADADAAAALIKRLHERLPALTIFAASDDPGVSLLRTLLEAGATDVLSLPLGSQELHKALIKFSQVRTKAGAAQAAGTVLTVVGVRGGPGVRAARRIVELLDRLSIPRERVDLIVTHAIPGPVSLADAARAIGKEVFHVLPRDEQGAGGAMNAGTPLAAPREAGLATAIG